jgi:prepilin peptidase CpaA
LIEATCMQWGVVIGASLAAAVWDVRIGKIPNRLTLPLAGAALVYTGWEHGWSGLGEAIVASFALALPYVILFLVAGGGAGDAKMMGMVGAWLGLEAGLVVLACVAAAGIVLAIVRMLAHRQRRTLFRNMWATLYVFVVAVCSGPRGWRLLRGDPREDATGQALQATIPYGVPIFIGVCLGAGVVRLWT